MAFLINNKEYVGMYTEKVSIPPVYKGIDFNLRNVELLLTLMIGFKCDWIIFFFFT